MSELQSILPVALGLVAAYLFLPPILIYGAQRFRRDMQILPFDPKTVPGSKKMTQYFDESIAAMAEIGFECLGEYSLPDFVPNAKAVVQMYRNVNTRESAMVNSIWGIAHGFVTARVQYAEFETRFEHDEIRLIQTANMSMPGSFSDDPREPTFRLPQIKDIEDLYHCHVRLLERHAPQAPRVLRVDEEFGGNAQEYLRHAVFVETFDHQIATGYLQTADVGWRPTVYGAMLMTWKELWPFKSMRTAALHRRGRSLAADLESEFGPLPESGGSPQ